MKSQGSAAQTAMQGDLFFLHLVEDLAEQGENGRGEEEGKANEDDAMDGMDGGETGNAGADLEEKVCWKLASYFRNTVPALLSYAQFLCNAEYVWFLPLTDGLFRKIQH